MTLPSLKRTFLTVAFACLVTSAFAEDAPVYDVDNFPPQFDGQPETSLIESATKDQAASEHAYAPQLSMDQRLARLEQQINNLLHTDLSAKVNDTQTEVQSLRGQVEELNHQLQVMQSQQKAMYSDLDKRISHQPAAVLAANPATTETASDTVAKEAVPKAVTPKSKFTASALSKPNPKLKSKSKLSVAEVTHASDTKMKTETSVATVAKPIVASAVETPVAKPAAVVTPARSNAQPNVAEEQQIYQTAYNLIKSKKYDEAATTLQKMLQKYPSGQFAANAHYWLGELYGLMGKNDQAISEFTVILRDYPTSPKLADAQLKLGLIYAAQSKWPDAKLAFKKVINRYPGTSWARLASQQLKQLKQTGHG